ncbi:divalent-cation tolerance protein CutA [Vibrio sp.]|uniref:divalent-cation tolerance protein CutA n=1 Tax=Vibrio sp. TaxID=678 RepID=UPI003D138618
MNQQYCVVLTTVNNPDVQQAIIDELLKNQLAACIQAVPIQSHYVWQDEVCADQETLLIIKTRPTCYQQLEQLIVRLHNYDTPQVLQLPVSDGFDPYLQWLKLNTRCQ